MCKYNIALMESLDLLRIHLVNLVEQFVQFEVIPLRWSHWLGMFGAQGTRFHYMQVELPQVQWLFHQTHVLEFLMPKQFHWHLESNCSSQVAARMIFQDQHRHRRCQLKYGNLHQQWCFTSYNTNSRCNRNKIEMTIVLTKEKSSLKFLGNF